MTFNRNLLVLSIFAALSFGAAACDDDSNNTTPGGDNQGGDEAQCTVANNTCKEGANVALVCVNGAMTEKPCNEDETCASGVCLPNSVPVEPECEVGTFVCDGSVLKECKDSGLETVRECADGTPVCDADAKTCKPECDANYTNSCLSDHARQFCDNGRIVKADCAGNEVCNAGACEVQCTADFVPECDSTVSFRTCEGGKFVTHACDDNEVCNAAQCEASSVEIDPDSVIGAPCTCDGDDCNFTISGKELKAALNLSKLYTNIKGPDYCKGLKALECAGVDAAISMFAPGYLNKIKDDQVITAPNFFSDSSQAACSDVEAPEGMIVGCLRNATITFPEGLTGLLGEVGEILGKIGGAIPDLSEALAGVGGAEGVTKLIEGVGTFLASGIEFKAANGYCLAANIDIDVKVTDPGINRIVLMDKVNPLIDRINTTGTDHQKAKFATCPAGSQLLWYDVQSGGGAEDLGSATVGFDMCLQSCATDADCRTGHSCIELPYGSAEDVANNTFVAHVCFDAANIEYFTAITEMFEPLLPVTEETEPAAE